LLKLGKKTNSALKRNFFLACLLYFSAYVILRSYNKRVFGLHIVFTVHHKFQYFDYIIIRRICNIKKILQTLVNLCNLHISCELHKLKCSHEETCMNSIQDIKSPELETK